MIPGVLLSHICDNQRDGIGDCWTPCNDLTLSLIASLIASSVELSLLFVIVILVYDWPLSPR
jgi:hypothetical protein